VMNSTITMPDEYINRLFFEQSQYEEGV